MIRRLTLATAVLLAACGSSTEPGITHGFAEQRVYVLRQMAGEALPGVITSPGGTIRFDADTLHLRPDGTGLQVTRLFMIPANGVAHEERWEARITYQLRGDGLEISYVCPPEEFAICTAPPHYRGSLSGATLPIDQAMRFPTPLEYERVLGSD